MPDPYREATPPLSVSTPMRPRKARARDGLVTVFIVVGTLLAAAAILGGSTLPGCGG
jgi:hypothetical protein